MRKNKTEEDENAIGYPNRKRFNWNKLYVRESDLLKR